VSSVGRRRQMTFVSDDHIENYEYDTCGGGSKTQTGVSDMTIHFHSDILGSHSSQKHMFVRMRQRCGKWDPKIEGNLPPGSRQRKALHVGHVKCIRAVKVDQPDLKLHRLCLNMSISRSRSIFFDVM
jgi:hypothetical protein